MNRLIRTGILAALGALICIQLYAQPASFQRAVPVWVNGQQNTPNLTASFRICIPWDGQSQTQLRLTAHSDYRAYVNGVFLGHGPCVAGKGFYRIDEYDLNPYLKSGDNLIALEVAGYNIPNFYIMNAPSFLQAEITSDGKVVAATTSGSWSKEGKPFEGAVLGQRLEEAPKFSYQRTQRELYKLTPDYNSWLTDPASPVFKPVALEQTDHKNLIARRVKYPDYTIRRYTESLPNNVYKFECNSTGFIGAKFDVRTPSKIVFLWDELLTNGGIKRRMSFDGRMEYELTPGTYELESFEPYTLQYLQVIVEKGDCKVSDFYIRQYVNSDVSRASFSCDNEGINKIYKAAVETYKQNALDIFMDCPSRERAGWLCDSYFTARVAFDLSGNHLIETNFLENFLLPEQFLNIPQGMLPMCYPSDHVNGNFIPNWAMWFVIELEEYLARSNDRQMIKALEPKVNALLDYFTRYENEDELLENLEKWVFVEWSKANDFVQDVNYPTNMLYARMLEVAGKLYNRPDLQQKAQRIHETIREQAFDGTFFIDNAVRVDGKLVPQPKNRTETCQYYAFFLGTASPERYPELWNILCTDFGPQRKQTGAYSEIYPANAFIGTYLRMEILSRYGLVKQLLNESVDQYLYMADQTGTLWENLTPTASCNHGFAAHIAHVFYRDLLGLTKIDPIHKRLNIVFNDSDLKQCSGTVPVGDEEISLSWEKKGKRLYYMLNTPAGYEVSIENKTALKPIAQ